MAVKYCLYKKPVKKIKHLNNWIRVILSRSVETCFFLNIKIIIYAYKKWQESEVTMSYKKKNVKRSRLTAFDCFVLGFHILGQDTRKSASKMADKLRTMWLYMAGAWVYNRTYFYICRIFGNRFLFFGKIYFNAE